VTKESAPVTLARQSLEFYLARREPMPLPVDLPEELKERSGVFVSLKKNGQLRGCIGTFAATQPTIGEEIIHNAISAGTADPRFGAVKPEELPGLTISVDILSAAEKIDSIAELDAQQYGVIVRRGRRSGLLLPALEGVDSVAEQVSIAKQKAGIAQDEEVELFRFRVVRYT